MIDFDLNYLAVLTAAVASMIIGFLWYGPIFGKKWIAAIGKSPEEISPAAGPIVISGASSIIASLALATLLKSAFVTNLGEGILWGVLVGAGFVATSAITNAVYEGKNTTLTLLFITYQIVALSVMGAILTAWR